MYHVDDSVYLINNHDISYKLVFFFFSFVMRAIPSFSFFFFFNDTATTEIYPLPLHDPLPIFVGFVDPDPARIGMPMINPGIVGAIDDIPLLVSRLNVDRVVVSLADARGKLPMDKLLDIRLESGVTFDHLASVYEEYTGKIAVENLRPSWLIFSEGFRKTRVLMAAKRALDLVFAIVGLMIGVPIMLLVGLLVKCTSRGPMFYHQTRVGLKGHEFTVHKFRTM